MKNSWKHGLLGEECDKSRKKVGRPWSQEYEDSEQRKHEHLAIFFFPFNFALLDSFHVKVLPTYILDECHNRLPSNIKRNEIKGGFQFESESTPHQWAGEKCVEAVQDDFG